MSYRVKRIDPYWIRNPALPAVAAVGVVAAITFVNRGMFLPAVVSAVVGGIAVILATKPAVTAVMATLGLLGGLTTFVFVPNVQNQAMALGLKLLSTLLFMVFYTVLMNGVVLLVSVLYNFFAGAVGMGGLSLELENDGDE